LPLAFPRVLHPAILQAMMMSGQHKRSKWQWRAVWLAPLLMLASGAAVCASPLRPALEAYRASPRLAAAPAIEDPDGRALHHFYRALTQTLARAPHPDGRAAVTRIVHYGDSHVAADLLTGALRSHFQRDFADAGAGFLLAGKPWPWYRREGIAGGSSAGWQVDGVKQAALAEDGRLGLAGVSLTTDRAGERMWLTAAGERFELYLLKQPGGGAVEVWLDGVRRHLRVSLAAPHPEPAYLALVAAPGIPHTIELRTLAPGLVRVFGVVAERDRAGVVYDALGVNGARASRPLAWDWPLFTDQMARRDPDLIVIAYGTNEVSDADLDFGEYRRNFAALLHRLREAAPRASLLVIAPPDRAARSGRRWRTIQALPELVKIQRQAALAAGAAFWDLFQAMGGPGAINRWAAQAPPLAQADRVHLTRDGYRLVADALYHELLRGYWRFLWRALWERENAGRN
jgi:lysophospholipase L1-like esterase